MASVADLMQCWRTGAGGHVLADASWGMLPAIGDDDGTDEVVQDVLDANLAPRRCDLDDMFAGLPGLSAELDYGSTDIGDDEERGPVLAGGAQGLVQGGDADLLVADVLDSLPCLPGDDMFTALPALIPTPCRSRGMYVGALRGGLMHMQHVRDLKVKKVVERDLAATRKDGACVEDAWNAMRLRDGDCVGDSCQQHQPQSNQGSFGGVIRSAFLQVEQPRLFALVLTT